jgi:hypothetical protein
MQEYECWSNVAPDSFLQHLKQAFEISSLDEGMQIDCSDDHS